MKVNKLWLLLIPVVLLGLALVGTAGWMLMKNNNADQYSLSIQNGSQLLEQEDYNGAIAAFQQAIRLDSTRLEGYEGLAKVYLAQGNAEALENLIRQYEEANNNRDI